MWKAFLVFLKYLAGSPVLLVVILMRTLGFALMLIAGFWFHQLFPREAFQAGVTVSKEFDDLIDEVWDLIPSWERN